MKDLQQAVLGILQNLTSLGPLKDLFWSQLNYERVNQPLSCRGWPESATRGLAEDPLLFAGHGDFHVIYARLNSDRLLLGLERPLVNKLLRDHPYALFLISDTTHIHWHFINVKYAEDAGKRRLFRRITVGPHERLRTATERIAMLDLESISREAALSPLSIQEKHDQAFDVEAVTNQFFDEYKLVFSLFEDDLERQNRDYAWAHDYALQFLNRVMFLYFVQRKRWLGNDQEFLKTFWEAYKQSGQPKDTFFDRWLSVLFFEAFNERFQAGRSDRRHFPEHLRQALALAPYLNGGLFLRNRLDDRYAFKITDTRFEHMFKFLQRYNFTIVEDSPLDQEVAVDPEMIGKVYESLVNVSENVDERGEAGIFYTPRTEIALMCRLALADHLTNHLGNERRKLLYEAVFALEEEEKQQADEALARDNLWPDLDRLLREITVLDPAVGSGSFLVGMLSLLSDLCRRANKQLGHQETDYELKKRIIGQSLYGVDVMQWAVDVCELRLWLQLVIDTELEPAELKFRPLLPNLSFKIRCGDSLVQEVGGINLSYIKAAHDIPSSLKGRLTQLKGEKLKFYNNDPQCKYRSDKQIFQEELRIFRDILEARYHNLTNEIKAVNRKIEGPQEAQIRLDGTVEPHAHQMELQAAEWQRQLEEIKSELEKVGGARQALRTAKDIPFVWDVAFVEIFEGDKEGFDIVTGNPPYVRQEKITDPRYREEERNQPEKKKTYKTKLARSVYIAYPRFFRYKQITDTAAHKLNAKSDLYIYFFFHGLSLLNPKGSFCFITSNSWLDVGYGSDLQEFLLKHCHVKMILDNQVRRSFSQADVNTIIALFSSPDDRKEWGLDRTARFVMFQAPFEQILSPVIFEEIEEATERKATPEYRVYPLPQQELLKDGIEITEEEEDSDSTKSKSVGPLIKVAKYIGNKWGGKYLRAPDIFFTILEKGRGKFARLSDIVPIQYGIKTGVNEFFFVDEETILDWGIEQRFLKPVIKSPRECKSIIVKREELKFKVFMCQEHKQALKGTNALEYIKYGESKGFHKRPSCIGRENWWDIGKRAFADALWPEFIYGLHKVLLNSSSIYESDKFYGLRCKPDKVIHILAFLNSAVSMIMRELGGFRGLGEGAQKTPVYEVRGFNVLLPDLFDDLACQRLQHAFAGIGKRPVSTNVFQEIHQPDRWKLDEVVFDVLGLTELEREAVYEGVINLVEARLKKAETV